MAQKQAVSIDVVFKAVNNILISLSEGNEIKVVFGGVPSTDGKTVYLGEPLTQSEEALEAYLSHGTHEIHHVLYSDFKGVSDLNELFMLVNVLEDVRIDAIGYHRSPGSYLWRESHLNKLAAEGKLPRAQGNTETAALLCVTCFWVMTDLMLGYEIARKHAQEAKEEFIQKFGEALYLEIMSLAERAVRSEKTSDVIAIAREIALRFSQSIGLTDSIEKTKQSGLAAKNATVETEKTFNDTEEERLISELFKGVSSEQVDFHRAVERSVSEKRQAEKGFEGEGGGAFWPIVRSELSVREDPEFTREAESLRISSHRKFHRFLQASASQRRGLSRFGREIESRQLSRVFIGDGRIFKDEVEAPKVSAAVTILLDRSGSMDRKFMRTASICSLVLAELIDSIPGCASSVLAFPGTERQTLLEVKDFGERAFTVMDRFCALRPFGYTPVKQSINSACAQLAGRRELRKIIFLITDGLYGEEDALKSMLPTLRASGIEIVCLGIGEEAPKIFEIQANIVSPQEMEIAALELFLKLSVVA